MLSIGKIASSAHAAAYYTTQVAPDPAAYYAGEGEAPGRWLGRGAEILGLRGQLEPDDLAALLAGAGQRDVEPGGVAGLDLTFRAPKSVSLLWALGDEDLGTVVWAAHRAAIVEALGYLEREACVVRRGRGGVLQSPGGGFVAAAFDHRTSRAGDPLVHTHVVAGNLARGPDGRWTALDARHLYAQAKTAGFLYEAVLREQLTRDLGVSWNRVENGIADVSGVPHELIDVFSKRRAEILKRMRERGETSAGAAQVAALDTRTPKDDRPLPERRAGWQREAAALGLDRSDLDALISPGRLPGPAAAVVLDELTQTSSAFTRADALQAFAAAAPDGASVAEIEAAANRALAADDVVALAPDVLGQWRFTTMRMLETERALLARADRAAREHHDVQASLVDRALARRASITDEQAAAVSRLCSEPSGLAVLRAPAGTGKTFVMDAARDAWTAGGKTVLGCSTSARAARELEDQAAIASLTIAQLRARLTEGAVIPAGGVLVVDEAGMVGTRALAELVLAAEHAHAKVVLVGDDRQLPEIGAGGAFRALAERSDAIELREVRRQRHDWDREALTALRVGDVERWARAYRDAGRITLAPTAELARNALVNDYLTGEGDRIMLACRRDDVSDLNARARQVLRDRGAFTGPALTAPGGLEFAAGDYVVATRNARRLGLLNGQRAAVERVDDDTLHLRLTNGRAVTLALRDLDLLDHGYALTAHRAQGATVDRAFVLGSEELYREWGYTALSRHREEARFYLARPDRQLDVDRAPGPDPLTEALQRMLGRSRAEQMATELLTDVPLDELERRHEQLRSQLASRLPTSPDEPTRAAEEHRALERLQRASAERLRTAAAGKPRRQRKTIESHALEARRSADRHGAAAADLERGATATQRSADRWFEGHRPESSEYLALVDEITNRRLAVARAQRHIATSSDIEIEPQLEPPIHDRGFDVP